MRITFDVGGVTVQGYMRLEHIPSNFGKLHILIRFKEYVDKILTMTMTMNDNEKDFIKHKDSL